MSWGDAATIAWIALGGGAGAAARYLVDTLVSSRWRGRFPLGIFVVNVCGALVLGLFLGMLDTGLLNTWLLNTGAGAGLPGLSILVTTGLLGGFTTFSTASYDTVRLARSGDRGMAAAYAVGTMLASVAAVLAGYWLGGLVWGGSWPGASWSGGGV